MSVPINPASDYVVAVAEAAETKTASGIFLPDKAQEKSKVARVVAIGKGIESVKVGDKIIYKNEYEATNVKLGKDEYILVFWKNIIATVK